MQSYGTLEYIKIFFVLYILKFIYLTAKICILVNVINANDIVNSKSIFPA